MSVAFIGFLGALVGGVLAGGASLWAAGLAGRQAKCAEVMRQRSVAYSTFIAAIGTAMLMIDGARTLGVERSGLRETLLLLTRTRRPSAPEDVLDLMIRGYQPLWRGWAEVWASGSPESVVLANNVMDQVSQLITVATDFGRDRRTIVLETRGIVWTDQEKENYVAEVRALAKLQKSFTELAREETGQPIAHLWPDAQRTDSNMV